jgi:hypothetical protein
VIQATKETGQVQAAVILVKWAASLFTLLSRCPLLLLIWLDLKLVVFVQLVLTTTSLRKVFALVALKANIKANLDKPGAWMP